MAIYLYLLGFLVILSLLVQQSVANEIAVKKGHESYKNRLFGLIPVYGIRRVLKMNNLIGTSQTAIDYSYAPSMLLKRTLIYGGLLIGATIIIAPLSVLGYLSFKNNLLQSLITIYVVLLIVFSYHSLVVDIAKAKGYEHLLVHLITLVPFYGLIYTLTRLPKGHLRATFMKKEQPNIVQYLMLSLIIVLLILPTSGLVFYLWVVPKKRNVSNSAILSNFGLGNILSRLLVYAEITLVSVIVLVPVIYIFGLAFSNISSAVPSTIWPEKPTFAALFYLFEETKFLKWYVNTLSIALVNMFVGTILITGAAYVFARFSFKGKKAGLLTILVLQAFPSFMGLIAMYVLFWTFNLLGKPLALSILYIGGSIPGNLWLIKGFLTQIPKDLDESAMIDGANKLQIFFKIILPLSVPILTFVAVSMFMGPWMDYMLPGYLLNYYPKNAGPNYDVTQQWTLAVGLFKFINDPQYMHYSAFAMGALFVGIPITILYMVFQKYLIEGIMAGATKG